VRQEHETPLAALGVPSKDIEALAAYLDLVAAWNDRTNLTGARTPEDRVRVLVADPWRAASYLRSGSVIDIGSGNGSPGLVLALLRPDVLVTLLEPRQKRWAFLREAARRLRRPDIMVARARCEEFGGAPARTATLRAVGIPLEAAARLVTPGGEVWVFGGQPEPSAELERTAVHPLELSELHVFQRV
jgi:16S rRNA (guanine527-N7)-methyltransferase